MSAILVDLTDNKFTALIDIPRRNPPLKINWKTV
jgi:hypothetical protein